MSYQPLYNKVHQQLTSNSRGWLTGGDRMARRKNSTTKSADKDGSMTDSQLTDDLVYDANSDLDEYDQSKKTRSDVQAVDDALTEKRLNESLASSPSSGKDKLWSIKIYNPDSASLKDGYELEDFHLQSASPTYEARLIQHPTEDGTVRIDNKVIQPRRFEIRGWVPETHLYTGGGSSQEIGVAAKYKEYLLALVESKNKKARIAVRMGEIWGWEEKNFNVIRVSSRASGDRVGIFDFTIIAQELMLATSKETNVRKGDLADSKNLGGQG